MNLFAYGPGGMLLRVSFGRRSTSTGNHFNAWTPTSESLAPSAKTIPSHWDHLEAVVVLRRMDFGG